MDPFIGQIMLFAGNFAPRTWAFCDGALLAISSNTALFSILGTTYGGDGRTTFALPDLRGRTPIGPRRGPGLSDYKLGQRSGVETVTLNTLQIPSHFHTTTNNAGLDQHVMLSSDVGVNVIPEPGDVPSAAIVAPSLGAGDDVKSFGPLTNANVIQGQQIIANAGVTVNPTGGNQSHPNMQPYVAVNYIIAMFGTYPSRS
tara:strand:- start:1053 stop:1652 length:600 start_codon:yes stop_codon:yes gene_type:complete